MKRICRSISHALPAVLTWYWRQLSIYVVGPWPTMPCWLSAVFFYILIPALVRQLGLVLGCSLCGLDILLFAFLISNLFMATCMDPGVHPTATNSEEAMMDDFRSPLYKNVEINGITVRMKWCVTCKIYRPPRSSHCSVCNRCIDCFDHHCPWVHNCVGRRNYRYFFLFLIFLSLHMICVFALCLSYTLVSKRDILTRPNLCAILLMALCALLAVPVIGLTGFHVVLVLRARTTNEQVTGKFRSGFNPFTTGCWGNLGRALCTSQFPRYEKPVARRSRRRRGGVEARKRESLTVIYVPADSSANNRDGHLRMKRSLEGDAGSVGTSLSLRAQTSTTNLSRVALAERRIQNNSSHCNLFSGEDDEEASTTGGRTACLDGGVDEVDIGEEEGSFKAKRNSAYDRSVREALGSARIPPSSLIERELEEGRNTNTHQPSTFPQLSQSRSTEEIGLQKPILENNAVGVLTKEEVFTIPGGGNGGNLNGGGPTHSSTTPQSIASVTSHSINHSTTTTSTSATKVPLTFTEAVLVHDSLSTCRSEV